MERIEWRGEGRRLLLVNPPWIRAKGNVWREIGSCSPPMGLAYLAAEALEQGAEVRFIDLDAERLLPERLPAALSGSEPPDMIGLSANTGTLTGARLTAEQLRHVFPEATMIIGGVHPTIRPEETLSTGLFDIAVRGEGELTLRTILDETPLEEIEGISYRTDGIIRHNRDRRELADVNQLPVPAYHLLPVLKYRPAVGSYQRLPALSVMVSRGCPWRCTFCYGSMLGSRYRFLSSERIIEEISLLRRDYGIREISFYDDTFTAHPDIGGLCQAMIRQRLDLTWSCFARADTVDRQLLRLMRRAGCHQVMYGLESADETVLDLLNKRINPAQVADAVRWSRKAGLETRVAVMFGNPGETETSLEKTVRYLERLNPDIIIANITTPYPGTEMYKWAKAQGYLKTENWEDYDLARCVMDLPTVDCEVVERYYHNVFRRYYFRPRYLAQRLKRLTSWREIRRNLESFRAVWAMRGERASPERER